MGELMTLRQLVGGNIRTLRKAKGWSQEELGEQADLSYKFVGEVERGMVNPSLDSLAGIANALDIEIAELFLREGLMVMTESEVAEVETAMAVLRNVLTSARNERAYPK